jgi:Flp pilus assembly protein TadG
MRIWNRSTSETGPRAAARRCLARLRGEEGGALVEIALTLPVMLAVLTGIFSFGIAFSNQLSLTQAVGTGAQLLQQSRNSTTDPCKDTLTAISNAAPNLTKANISLTLTLNGTSTTASSCAGSQSNLVEGQPITVAATYPCNLQVYGVKFVSACQLAAQVTEYEY